MSWMKKLYETYEAAQRVPSAVGVAPPLPPSHTSQQAHVEIVLNAQGDFLRASIVNKEETLLPATEESAARTSGGEPHPLCDKIQYVAGDYASYGGGKPSYFDDFKSGKETKKGYLSLLKDWSEKLCDAKLSAIFRYVSKRAVVSDLIREKILFVDEERKLITKWPAKDGEPPIFGVLTKKSGEIDQGDAFVRWCVEMPGERESRVWRDEALIQSWIEYDLSLKSKTGLCYVSGSETVVSSLHPAKIRHGGDKAKLISSNDLSGFTFLGRFTDANQACAIGYEVTQKAHSVLRWLVKRQAFRNDDQVVVAWDTSNKEIPSFLENSADAMLVDLMREEGIEPFDEPSSATGDLGESYAKKLSGKIAGYREILDDRDDIVVMGLDSSTPGRMAITYYRELKGSEFLERVEAWHRDYAWLQNFSKDFRFVGAPSPKDMASAAFGRRIDPKLSKTTVMRILPCIVDGIVLPEDLWRMIFNRTKNPVSMEHWEWEKILGIACGIYRGLHKEMKYAMALEQGRATRDYLYGRLLAVAERLEMVALSVAGEQRDTNAAKLMNRFAEHPYSTWKRIELALSPYKSRLLGTRPSFLVKMTNLLDEICCKFRTEDYVDDSPLTGEFLLGYHCQRRDLKMKLKNESSEDETMKKTILNEEADEDVAE